MNHLAPAPDDGDAARDSERYLLPRHAHIVVYEREPTAEDDAGGDPGSGVEDDAGRDPEPTEVDDGDERSGAASDGAGRASQLVTVYDCGAAQKPPSAQLLGELGSVRAACETTRNPTGYVVRMREPSLLVDEGNGQYVVRSR